MNPARESIATETFGPYEVFERLGMGGMASVHRAKKRGPAGFEQTVALKRMLSHLTEDRGFVESFVREAKVASMLAHPNIAQVYDFGRIGGIFYIAMELVGGFDLRKLLRHAHKTGEALPLGIILSVLAELCDALDYAHSFVDENGQHLNIIHRDISPSNIIVAHTGHVKVIDFGIAKASSRQLHTESGLVKGKLGYMAPEAAMGMAVGAQADIFSVGVTAWELVTALPLFSARTDFETMRKLREEPVTPPSYNNPACPPRLDALILAALAREPEHRIASARMMRNEIDAIAQQHNVQFSARAVADWTRRLADQSARASTDVGGMRSPSGRALPLPPEPQTAVVVRSRPGTQPQTLRRSDEDIALATEIWGEDATQAPPGEDFSAVGGSVVPMGAPAVHDLYSGARVTTAADMQVPQLRPSGTAHAGFTPSHPSVPQYQTVHPSGAPYQTAHPSGPIGFPSAPSYAQPVSSPGPYAPAAAGSETKSRVPMLILATLAIVAGVLGALLYVKKTKDTPPELPREVPRVTIKFNITPPGSIVEVAGKELGPSPVEAQLAPGVYSIDVHHDGFTPWETSLAVREGEAQEINIKLDEQPAVAAVTPPPVAPPSTQEPPPQNTTDSPATDTSDDANAKPSGGRKHTTKHDTHKVEGGAREGGAREGGAREGGAREGGAREKTPAVASVEPPKQDPVKVDPAKQDPVKVDPPKQEPPKQEPPKQEPVDTKPKTTPGVAPTAVTKLSGEIPQLHGNGEVAVQAKLCIDEQGRVSSVKILTAPPDISADLQRALMTWHYKPYMKGDKPSAVCFPWGSRLILK